MEMKQCINCENGWYGGKMPKRLSCTRCYHQMPRNLTCKLAFSIRKTLQKPLRLYNKLRWRKPVKQKYEFYAWMRADNVEGEPLQGICPVWTSESLARNHPPPWVEPKGETVLVVVGLTGVQHYWMGLQGNYPMAEGKSIVAHLID